MHRAVEIPTRGRARGGWVDRSPADTIAAKRERLGTALHELASDLARERRRSAHLERENRRLHDLLAAAGVSPAS
jgi:hypothetical protein